MTLWFNCVGILCTVGWNSPLETNVCSPHWDIRRFAFYALALTCAPLRYVALCCAGDFSRDIRRRRLGPKHAARYPFPFYDNRESGCLLCAKKCCCWVFVL